ncbi:PIN domain-containing protein [Oceanobacillus locisalsi]|uniref:PIN domain-containing protein n=1 Tax=Oceanobacillus locisalsi TaxID=546107 RepID=A0ABW3NMY4_9BACI
MNSIFHRDKPPKVFLDTTVICGAIRKDGINRNLLKLARMTDLYHLVLSKVCLFEFVRNAINGIGRGSKEIKYEIWEIEKFMFDFIYPILEIYEKLPVNSVVGRYSMETRRRENQPIGKVLSELTGLNHEKAKRLAINQTSEMKIPLNYYDQEDFHVWAAAIQQNCQYIITTNTRRFPSQIGKIKCMHPAVFYQYIEEYLNY